MFIFIGKVRLVRLGKRVLRSGVVNATNWRYMTLEMTIYNIGHLKGRFEECSSSILLSLTSKQFTTYELFGCLFVLLQHVACNLQLPANWVIYFWGWDELPIFVCTCAMQTSVLGVRGNVTETVPCNYFNKWWTFCTSWLYVYRTMELLRCPKSMIVMTLVCLCSVYPIGYCCQVISKYKCVWTYFMNESMNYNLSGYRTSVELTYLARKYFISESSCFDGRNIWRVLSNFVNYDVFQDQGIRSMHKK